MIQNESTSATVTTFIYRSEKKADHFLYLNKLEASNDVAGDMSKVPEALLKMLGEINLVLKLDISATTKLAAANADKVLQALKEDGFYLQIPPNNFVHPLDLEDGVIEEELPHYFN